MKIHPEILTRFQMILDESGLSNRKFAASLGLSPSNITEIMNGRIRTLSGLLTKGMESRYGVNLDWLQNGEGNPYLSSITVSGKEEIALLNRIFSLDKQSLRMVEAFLDTLGKRRSSRAGIDPDD